VVTLVLRRASVSRPSGAWGDDDYHIFDGDRNVGGIYRVNAATELWWWGVEFDLTGGRSPR
jgi:hypothetical protein